MSSNVKFEEAPDSVLPKCPYCKVELNTIWMKRKGMGFIQQKQLLMCPHCQAFLGYGSVKFT